MSDGPRRRGLSFWIRWLHTYVSVLGFGTLIFFSITGITLNHAAYFEAGGEREREFEAPIAAALVARADGGAVDRLGLVEHLRAEHGLRGAVAEFVEEGGGVTVVFKGPAYSADVWVDRARGQAEIFELRLGAWALLDDLHKGRDSGSAWSWLIDISAGVLVVASVTGLWLLLYVRRRRTPGLLVTVFGTAALVAVWALGVP